MERWRPAGRGAASTRARAGYRLAPSGADTVLAPPPMRATGTSSPSPPSLGTGQARRGGTPGLRWHAPPVDHHRFGSAHREHARRGQGARNLALRTSPVTRPRTWQRDRAAASGYGTRPRNPHRPASPDRPSRGDTAELTPTRVRPGRAGHESTRHAHGGRRCRQRGGPGPPARVLLVDASRVSPAR
ncbi:hypothetical protein FTX61_07550 [Nitriliruptoraceae bacterium ZYF776]|nr:hypothetical protein [Profundirhabdus halotolerans]